MRKIIYIIIMVLFSVNFSFSQNNTWDNIHYQNSTVHDAIISPVPMSIPQFYVKSNQLITRIEVIDILGKTIYIKHPHNYTFEPIEVNLPPCKKGIYFVKITFDDNTYIIKKTIYR